MAHYQLLFARWSGRYSAHLGQAGPLSPADITLIVAGSVVAIVGFLLLNMKPSSVTGPGRLRRLGAPLLGIGLCIATFGPGLVHRENCDQPTPGAAIEIVSPKPRQQFATTEVPVSVETKESGSDQSEPIHLRLILDGRTVSRVAAEKQTVDALPGDHELVVELLSSNREPFCRRVTDEVKFSVVE